MFSTRIAIDKACSQPLEQQRGEKILRRVFCGRLSIGKKPPPERHRVLSRIPGNDALILAAVLAPEAGKRLQAWRVRGAGPQLPSDVPRHGPRESAREPDQRAGRTMWLFGLLP